MHTLLIQGLVLRTNDDDAIAYLEDIELPDEDDFDVSTLNEEELHDFVGDMLDIVGKELGLLVSYKSLTVCEPPTTEERLAAFKEFIGEDFDGEEPLPFVTVKGVTFKEQLKVDTFVSLVGAKLATEILTSNRYKLEI